MRLPTEQLRINIGLAVIILLNLVALASSIEQTVRLKRIEAANQDLSRLLRMERHQRSCQPSNTLPHEK